MNLHVPQLTEWLRDHINFLGMSVIGFMGKPTLVQDMLLFFAIPVCCMLVAFSYTSQNR